VLNKIQNPYKMETDKGIMRRYKLVTLIYLQIKTKMADTRFIYSRLQRLFSTDVINSKSRRNNQLKVMDINSNQHLEN
jgi:hypothetical protein